MPLELYYEHNTQGVFMRIIVPAAIALGLATPLAAQGPIGPITVAGPKSKVLTVGSVHLSAYDKWTPAMLEPLLAKLATFQPTVITQEGLSGEQCYAMRQHPDLYGESIDSYCWNPDTIIGETRLSVPQAMMEVRRTLASWPEAPSAAERRRLAVLFLAAGDRVSAKVQWLRLPLAERKAADGLSDKMIEVIERKGRKMNESYDVAAVLAARLGLDQVHAVDDHTSDAATIDAGPSYVEELQGRYREPGIVSLIANDKARTAKVVDGPSLLSLYRNLNAPEGTREAVEADFAGALKLNSPHLSGRKYMGWWDVRNLRMVANVRASFAARPGARVLNIVGSSHKPWYDHLLATMPDVEVVDAAAILR